MRARPFTSTVAVLLLIGCSGPELSSETPCSEIGDSYKVYDPNSMDDLGGELSRLIGEEMGTNLAVAVAIYCSDNPDETLGAAITRTAPEPDGPISPGPVTDLGPVRTGEGAGSDAETGTATLTFTVEELSTAQTAADALTVQASSYDAMPAVVDGDVVTLVIENITLGEAQDFDHRPPQVLSLRPVVELVRAGEPEVDLIPSMSGGSFAVGPARGDETAFGTATVATDEDGRFSVVVAVASKDVWDFLAEQCFDRSAICPSTFDDQNGQIAVVVNSKIVAAPFVDQPTFPDEIEIPGGFSETEAQRLADTINDRPVPFKIGNRSIEFEPDSES